MTSPTPNIPDDMAVVVEAQSLFHAQTLAAILSDYDIQAQAAPDIQYGAGVHPDAAICPVAVITSAAEADRARDILQQVAANADSIDWEQEVAEQSPAAPVPVGGMPLVAKAGLIAGLLIIALMIVGAILMVVL